MRLVVADTSPLNYLILIGHAVLLSSLFEKIIVPHVVRDELTHMGAPEEVRRWIAAPPAWLEVVTVDLRNDDPDLLRLDDGEHAAILLAEKMRADLLLVDDRDGARIARRRGLAVAGTLGILDLAAYRGLIDIDDAVKRLRATSFRCHPDVLEAMLARHGRGVRP